MSSSRPLLLASLACLGLAFASGCTAPCERYCDLASDYIEACLESGSQGEWQDANDWAVWGAESKDEYAATCKDDMDAQLGAASDSSALDRACEDDGNRYLELTERGLCADIP